jgi:hypothetical protein
MRSRSYRNGKKGGKSRKHKGGLRPQGEFFPVLFFTEVDHKKGGKSRRGGGHGYSVPHWPWAQVQGIRAFPQQ